MCCVALGAISSRAFQEYASVVFQKPSRDPNLSATVYTTSLWCPYGEELLCCFSCFLLLNVMCSEKVNPETIHVFLRNRNAIFSQLLTQGLNNKQKILPTYDQEGT